MATIIQEPTTAKGFLRKNDYVVLHNDAHCELFINNERYNSVSHYVFYQTIYPYNRHLAKTLLKKPALVAWQLFQNNLLNSFNRIGTMTLSVLRNLLKETSKFVSKEWLLSTGEGKLLYLPKKDIMIRGDKYDFSQLVPEILTALRTEYQLEELKKNVRVPTMEEKTQAIFNQQLPNILKQLQLNGIGGWVATKEDILKAYYALDARLNNYTVWETLYDQYQHTVNEALQASSYTNYTFVEEFVNFYTEQIIVFNMWWKNNNSSMLLEFLLQEGRKFYMDRYERGKDLAAYNNFYMAKLKEANVTIANDGLLANIRQIWEIEKNNWKVSFEEWMALQYVRLRFGAVDLDYILHRKGCELIQPLMNRVIELWKNKKLVINVEKVITSNVPLLGGNVTIDTIDYATEFAPPPEQYDAISLVVPNKEPVMVDDNKFLDILRDNLYIERLGGEKILVPYVRYYIWYNLVYSIGFRTQEKPDPFKIFFKDNQWQPVEKIFDQLQKYIWHQHSFIINSAMEKALYLKFKGDTQVSKELQILLASTAPHLEYDGFNSAFALKILKKIRENLPDKIKKLGEARPTSYIQIEKGRSRLLELILEKKSKTQLLDMLSCIKKKGVAIDELNIEIDDKKALQRMAYNLVRNLEALGTIIHDCLPADILDLFSSKREILEEEEFDGSGYDKFEYDDSDENSPVMKLKPKRMDKFSYTEEKYITFDDFAPAKLIQLLNMSNVFAKQRGEKISYFLLLNLFNTFFIACTSLNSLKIDPKYFINVNDILQQYDYEPDIKLTGILQNYGAILASQGDKLFKNSYHQFEQYWEVQELSTIRDGDVIKILLRIHLLSQKLEQLTLNTCRDLFKIDTEDWLKIIETVSQSSFPDFIGQMDSKYIPIFNNLTIYLKDKSQDNSIYGKSLKHFLYILAR